MLPAWILQLCQVLTLLVFAPLVSGVISRLEAMIQSRHGPSIFQPYYDILKYFRKETVLPEFSSWLFRAGPYVSFTAYLSVALLIPVLTNFPLPLGYMGDILGGAFLLALASFAIGLAALDTASPYAGLGSSRAVSFGALIEPTLIFVFFTTALVSHTDNPYAMNATLRDSVEQVFRPAHLLAAAAFFLMLMADTGRIPVESSSSTLEFGMIDEARLFEYSGSAMALLRWGSAMKQFLLYVLFLNVFFFPWGVAGNAGVTTVLVSLGSLLLKMLGVGLVIVAIESAFAKLRLFKITEFMAAGFILAVLAVLDAYLGGG
ncbi:MAG TPA: NADH-quinone oxidoreductase subunit H [Chloroflexota bacterium]|nr:NADH-quinone oxidoreductase subunit H [Chloroflexota bacterium]